jgi:hypothetical protein
VTSRVAGLPNDVGVWPEVKTDAEIWPREKGRITAGSWVPKGALKEGGDLCNCVEVSMGPAESSCICLFVCSLLLSYFHLLADRS